MCKKLFNKCLVLFFVFVIGLTLFSSFILAAAPKYVFYMIGDGMGATQRQVAQYFLQAKTGNEQAKLVMNTFPVTGIVTTYAENTLVTDSAAAGTALATGYKTNSGIISMLPDGTSIKTLAEAAEEKGMATGLITTTRLTHATPAVFASHNIDRDAENEIAVDYLDSGIEFFAGGGYRHFVPQNWQWGKSKRKDNLNVAQKFYEEGYNIFLTEDDTAKFRAYKPKGREKVFASFTYAHMPFDIDRDKSRVPSLAEMTKKGIDVLSEYSNGFFLMVEGGRIDHACHANDPVGCIYDTLAFDDAIAEVYKFYQAHPSETLIVVAADHETGGFGLGFGKNYFLKLDALFADKISVKDTLQGIYQGNRTQFYNYIAENMGLTNLTSEEKAKIEKAMDLVDSGKKVSINEYGDYDPVAITATHILSERANMYWTTYAHSGTPIALTAVGVGAADFGGYKDNTEICRTLVSLMNFEMSF